MILASLAAWAITPLLLVGVIQRVKSLWAGRRGPPLLQPVYDLIRLARKQRVLSVTTTPLFRIAPWISLLTAAAAASVIPLLTVRSLVSFEYDFVWLAYVWSVGRAFSILAALDTGSAFEGMGAARDATFSSLVEPVLFLVTGTLVVASHQLRLHEALVWQASQGSLVVSALCAFALLITLQVETARMPVDDPATHLELTMVHEVMILDHSGPDLAVLQYGLAIKLASVCALISMLLNPWALSGGWFAVVTSLALNVLLAVTVGTIESLSARLQLRSVPRYIFVALAAAAVALLATAWRSGGHA